MFGRAPSTSRLCPHAAAGRLGSAPLPSAGDRRPVHLRRLQVGDAAPVPELPEALRDRPASGQRRRSGRDRGPQPAPSPRAAAGRRRDPLRPPLAGRAAARHGVAQSGDVLSGGHRAAAAGAHARPVAPRPLRRDVLLLAGDGGGAGPLVGATAAGRPQEPHP